MVVTEDDPSGAGAADPAPGWRAWRRGPNTTGRRPEAMEIGAISDRVAEALEREGYEDPPAHGITITRERLYHMASAHPAPGRGRRRPKPRLTPADLDRLPQGLARPRAVLYDTDRRELVYAYDATAPEREVIKVVVQPNMSQSLKLGEQPRETVTSHSVRTAGYVRCHNLAEPRYHLLDGSLEQPAADDEPVVVGRLRPGRWEGGER